MLNAAQRRTLAELPHLTIVCPDALSVVKGAGGALYLLEADGGLRSLTGEERELVDYRRRNVRSGSTK